MSNPCSNYDNFCALLPTPVLMQSLMGGTPKTALHRYSLLPS
ncbi:hypothetical protein [Moorena producens]